MVDDCPEVCEDDQLEWYRDEVLLMQDELDTTLDDLQEAKENWDKYRDKYVEARNKIKWIKQETIENMTEKNKTITTRMLALSDIVDEYDVILDRYIAFTNTKLVTSKLNELRKRGGYSKL